MLSTVTSSVVTSPTVSLQRIDAFDSALDDDELTSSFGSAIGGIGGGGGGGGGGRGEDDDGDDVPTQHLRW